MPDPHPPPPNRRGEATGRLGWCMDWHHEQCPKEVGSLGCLCPCHDDDKRRSKA